VRSTSTTVGLKDCQILIYTVQQTDTLEELEKRFSVSKAKLRAANHLNADTVTTGMELMIPICKSTPTGTFDALTTTFTPILNATTSTPGG
jgi:LysM repeat protein